MKALDNSTSVKIPAKPEFVGIARLITAAYASFLGFDQETAEDIKVAVSEACTTAIIQVHKEAKTDKSVDTTVTITTYADLGNLFIDIKYTGKDIASVRKAHTQLPERDLGLSLLTAIMDKIEVIHSRDKEIIIRLIKKIKP